MFTFSLIHISVYILMSMLFVIFSTCNCNIFQRKLQQVADWFVFDSKKLKLQNHLCNMFT